MLTTGSTLLPVKQGILNGANSLTEGLSGGFPDIPAGDFPAAYLLQIAQLVGSAPVELREVAAQDGRTPPSEGKLLPLGTTQHDNLLIPVSALVTGEQGNDRGQVKVATDGHAALRDLLQDGYRLPGTPSGALKPSVPGTTRQTILADEKVDLSARGSLVEEKIAQKLPGLIRSERQSELSVEIHTERVKPNTRVVDLNPVDMRMPMQSQQTVRYDSVRMYPINVPFNQPQWGEALANRLMWLVNDQQQAAQIKLNPPELGPVEVRITMKNDQANVSFFVQHGVVREAIEDAFPKLREMLNHNGLSLGDVNVASHSQQHKGSEHINHNFADWNTEEQQDDQEISIMSPARLHLGIIDQYV